MLAQKKNLLDADKQLALFSSPVTLYIYIAILIFIDEGASGPYLTIFLINKIKLFCGRFNKVPATAVHNLFRLQDRVAGLHL